MFTKDDYVNLETAKILKESGFNKPCQMFYCKMYDSITSTLYKSCRFNHVTYSELEEGDILIPSLYKAQKWLIKRYNIYVCPTPYLSKGGEECAWFIVEIYRKDETNWEWFADADGKYISYEQALDIGIRRALELIKED